MLSRSLSRADVRNRTSETVSRPTEIVALKVNPRTEAIVAIENEPMLENLRFSAEIDYSVIETENMSAEAGSRANLSTEAIGTIEIESALEYSNDSSNN